MNIFLIILVLGGIVQAFCLKRLSYKIISIAIAVYAVSLMFWNDKPNMGLVWLLLYAPFGAYIIFIQYQNFSEKYNRNTTNECDAKEPLNYLQVGANIIFFIAIAIFIAFIVWSYSLCVG